jgi:hypothetical protein
MCSSRGVGIGARRRDRAVFGGLKEGINYVFYTIQEGNEDQLLGQIEEMIEAENIARV